MKIGIISGHDIPNLLKNPEKTIIETPYGDIQVKISNMKTHDLFFINRHGENANIPPHKINYLGNIQALVSSHVEYILSIGTVGSMKKKIQPGDLVIPHDFVDFTKSREYTFFNDQRVHVEMTNPYCPSLREYLIKICKKMHDVTFYEKGIYLATEGPRLETASEINYYANVADIVGMTGVPEIVLAREKNMCYAALCLVCNMATGFQKKVAADEISKIYNEKSAVISNIVQLTLKSIDNTSYCICNSDIKKATL
jgi:5'-methylthioadenosine phosphorylase